jgi:DeoR/GlpR family transcriptional regulator of sugar metabolism
MLSERQALEVASALTTQRNLAAQTAAQKIRDQARVNLDAGETRKAVDLVPEERAELAAVMNEVAWPDEPEYARLRRQLSRA